tara:strand:+ start:366 stop:890 length:525 start_codon:yes stop_codon:yes gene_type:complete
MAFLQTPSPAIHAVHWKTQVESTTNNVNDANILFKEVKHCVSQGVSLNRARCYRRLHSNAKLSQKQPPSQSTIENAKKLAATRSSKVIREKKQLYEREQQKIAEDKTITWYSSRHPHYAISLSKTRSKLHFKEQVKTQRTATQKKTDEKQRNSQWKKTFKQLLKSVERRKELQQ